MNIITGISKCRKFVTTSSLVHSLLVGGLLLASTQTLAHASLYPGALYEAGEYPRVVALGDMDDDGNLDVVIVRQNFDNHVSVLLGNGTGGITGKIDYPLGHRPNDIVLGDVNNDGNLDVITANAFDDNISVLLGDGTGDFTIKTDYQVGDYPNSVELGDLDGDGDLDVVTANVGTNSISLLLGNGTGDFGAKDDVVVGSGPEMVALGDLDGDGALDVVTANSVDDSVSVLLGNGTGGFDAKTDYTVIHGPASVALGDVDGDGNLDIATANSSLNINSEYTVSVLVGDGTGAFVTNGDYTVGDTPYDIALDDVNSDSNLDVVTANVDANNVSVLLGDGLGAFGTKTDYPVGSRPYSVALGDMDGNGSLDVVTANYQSSNVSVLLNNGASGFLSLTDYQAGDSPSSAILGDLDADGDLDAVTANLIADNIDVLLNDGAGKFTAKFSYTVNNAPNFVALGDVDSDGDLDAVTANGDTPLTPGSISVLLNNGAGDFTATSPRDYTVGNSPVSVALGDVDDDGNLDVVTANVDASSVSVLLGDGAGGFGINTEYTVGDRPESVALGDVDGDNRLDIITANYASSNVSVLLNNGLGGFDTKTGYPVRDAPNSVALGDLDDNGLLDIVVVHGTYGASILLNTGSGVFGTTTDYPVGGRPASVALDDVNGDGYLDVVTSNYDDGSITTLLGDGSGGVLAKASYAAGIFPDSIALGNLDSDNQLDVVIASSSTDSLRVLLQNNIAPVAVDGELELEPDTVGFDTLMATDANGDTLTYSTVTGAAHGIVTLTNPTTGAYNYSPATGYSGADSFTFKVSDGSADSNTAAVNLTINGIPVAQDGTLNAIYHAVGGPNPVATGTVVATDFEGDTLTYSIVSGAQHGTAYLEDATTGNYRYIPNDGYAGSDSFTFKANDGAVDSNIATVSITVDRRPVAQDDTLTLDEDTAANGILIATDPDGNALTYSIPLGAEHGTVTITDATTGAYSYIPDAGYSGVDSFFFTVDDGFLQGNATVSITVNAVNDAPVAIDENLTLDEDTFGFGTLKSTDVDGGARSYSIVTAAAHGTVTIPDATEATYHYIPDTNFNGTDSFTFKANDGAADSNTATVSITVNAVDDEPVPSDGSLTLDEDTVDTGTLVATDVDGDTISYSIRTDPAFGTVAITDSATGAYSYTPDADYSGADSFTFKASDGSVNYSAGTVQITVNAINDEPVASNGSLTLNEDAVGSGTLIATDLDSDALTYSIESRAAHGTVMIIDAATGAYSYMPNTGYSGSDSFTFHVSDGSAQSNTGTISITVNKVSSGNGGDNPTPPPTTSGGGGGSWGFLGLLALLGVAWRCRSALGLME